MPGTQGAAIRVGAFPVISGIRSLARLRQCGAQDQSERSRLRICRTTDLPGEVRRACASALVRRSGLAHRLLGTASRGPALIARARIRHDHRVCSYTACGAALRVEPALAALPEATRLGLFPKHMATAGQRPLLHLLSSCPDSRRIVGMYICRTLHVRYERRIELGFCHLSIL